MITGVKLEFSRASHGQRGGAFGVYKRTGGVILQVLGARIKRRVVRRGDLAGQPVAPYPAGRRKIVNARYPISGGREETGGRLIRRGAGVKVFESSRDMHRSTRLGSFWVTGGMWGGYSLVVGTKTSQLRFRGRSPGQEVRLLRFRGSDSRFRFERREGGQALFEARVSGAQVPNARKAGAVFTSRGISLLAISNRELAGLSGGLIMSVVRSVVAVGPAAVEWQGVTTDEMAKEVFRRL